MNQQPLPRKKIHKKCFPWKRYANTIWLKFVAENGVTGHTPKCWDGLECRLYRKHLTTQKLKSGAAFRRWNSNPSQEKNTPKMFSLKTLCEYDTTKVCSGKRCIRSLLQNTAYRNAIFNICIPYENKAIQIECRSRCVVRLKVCRVYSNYKKHNKYYMPIPPSPPPPPVPQVSKSKQPRRIPIPRIHKNTTKYLMMYIHTYSYTILNAILSVSVDVARHESVLCWNCSSINVDVSAWNIFRIVCPLWGESRGYQ